MASLNESFSLEICTDDENAWATFMSICGESFQQHASFIYSHPDPEKRKLFLPAYFKYIYETELSHGRAGLACVKVAKGTSKPSIVYAACGIYPGSKKTDADKSEMAKGGERGMQLCLEEDEWLQKAIHEKMKRMSDMLGITSMYYCYQACLKEYLNHGIGLKYFSDAVDLIAHDGIQQNVISSSKTLLAYGTLDDNRARRFQTVYMGATEIGHLHRPNSSGRPIRCVDKMEDKIEKQFDCVFVVSKEIRKTKYVMERLKDAMGLRSHM